MIGTDQEAQPGAMQGGVGGVIARHGDRALRLATVLLLAAACFELAGLRQAVDARWQPPAYAMTPEPPPVAGGDSEKMLGKMDALGFKLDGITRAVCATGTHQGLEAGAACSIAP